MVRKHGKVLCCIFLFPILGFDPVQNHVKMQKDVHRQLTNESIALSNSCKVSEHKTKDVEGQEPSNLNCILFFFFFDVYWPPNHFFLNKKCKCNLFTPATEHQEFTRTRSEMSVHSRIELEFGRTGENRSTRRKTSRSRVENQKQTQPPYDAGSENWTRATLVVDGFSQGGLEARPINKCFAFELYYRVFFSITWLFICEGFHRSRVANRSTV